MKVLAGTARHSVWLSSQSCPHGILGELLSCQTASALLPAGTQHHRVTLHPWMVRESSRCWIPGTGTSPV